MPSTPSSISAPARQLIVFDFDWFVLVCFRSTPLQVQQSSTLTYFLSLHCTASSLDNNANTDQDSDHWVCEVLSPAVRQKMEDESSSNKVWSDIVADCMIDLHCEGFREKDILECLKGIPFHPAMKRSVQALKSRTTNDTAFLCISNANSFFIETILAHHDLSNHFSKIITNPASFLSNGVLQVRRWIDPESPNQHKCDLCQANLCKGDELDKYIKETGGWESYDKIAYVGDGSNDFCPLLRLRTQDAALVRSHRALARIMKDEPRAKEVKAEIKFWREAWQLERIFDTY